MALARAEIGKKGSHIQQIPKTDVKGEGAEPTIKSTWWGHGGRGSGTGHEG